MTDSNRPTDPASLPMDVKRKLLAARDALAEGDAMEAYHRIYSIACPDFAKHIDEVWTALETPAPESSPGARVALNELHQIDHDLFGPAASADFDPLENFAQWCLGASPDDEGMVQHIIDNARGALAHAAEIKARKSPGEPSGDCKECDKLIGERDKAEEQADELAACIAALLDIDIGEHSSGNAPWQNAIDAAEYELDKRKRVSGEPSGNLKRATGLGDMEEAMGLDEVVAVGCNFHIERLGEGQFWFSVQAGDKDLAVWLSANRKGFITATHEWRSETKEASRG